MIPEKHAYTYTHRHKSVNTHKRHMIPEKNTHISASKQVRNARLLTFADHTHIKKTEKVYYIMENDSRKKCGNKNKSIKTLVLKGLDRFCSAKMTCFYYSM